MYQLPSNNFLEWLKEKQDSKHLEIEFEMYESGYLAERITKEKIETWNPKVPVFISAQTGRGKNYFVLNVLLRNLIRENHKKGTGEKLLLLSNRTALNRQTKNEIMELLLSEEGKNFRKQSGYYSPEGRDKYMKDFDLVYVCPYQSLNFRTEWEKILKQKFKYVVCDECHYFTSDAPFNAKTNEILYGIVKNFQNSIRIYMSSTMDVVFESIIRAEYKPFQSMIDEIIENKEKSLSSPGPGIVVDTINTFSELYDAQNKLNNAWQRNDWGNINALQYNVQVKWQNLYALSNEARGNQYEELIRQVKLKIKFYYMERNYDYVSDVFVYTDEEELTKKIENDVKNNSKTKWLVFVRRKKSGKSLLQKLEKANINCVFIDADSKNSGDERENEFQKIVEEEKFQSTVLIATSALDNGINIKDKLVQNVAIDFFNKTEFLQMLGRVRVENGRKIKIFIKRYQIEDLFSILKESIERLLDILEFDTIEKGNRNEWVAEQISNTHGYGIEIFEYINGAFNYNENGVYYWLDIAFSCIRVLQKIGEDYHSVLGNLSEHYQELRGKIYSFYIYNDGYLKEWSRNIVDLLENETSAKERKNQIEEDEFRGIASVYAYDFQNNFSYYLYNTMIINFFNNGIESAIKTIQHGLGPTEVSRSYIDPSGIVVTEKVPVEYQRTEYDEIIEKRSKQKNLSSFEKLQILKEYVKRIRKFTIDISEYEKINEKIEFYKKLIEERINFPEDVFMYWLEKPEEHPKKIDMSDSQSNIDERVDFYDKFLKNCIVPSEEMRKYTHKKMDGSHSDKYYDLKFLEEHGILKDSPYSRSFEKFYGVRLNKGMKFRLKEYENREIQIQSYNDGSEKHATYFVLHPCSEPAEKS